VSKIQISHDPKLDLEKLAATLRAQFAGRYEIVEKTYLIGFSGFIVKKNAFIGAAVSIEQEPGKTFVAVHPVVPSVAARLLGPLFLLLFRNQVVKDVEQFLGSEALTGAQPAH
jgi:hypothetical protein